MEKHSSLYSYVYLIDLVKRDLIWRVKFNLQFITGTVLLFRYAALESMEKHSKPDSFFEALEVRGLPDTPSENSPLIF